ncbi:primosomal protein N' [Rhodothermus profundi]|nr:primosomal protein N' [Rhodothermus profundi]
MTMSPDMVQVALPLPLMQCFTYRVPPAWQDAVQPGCRVLVPFGRRHLTGVVVPEAPPASLPDSLKPILDVLDDEPALTEELLQLTRWMADYYVCSWGEVIRAALPPGLEIESRRRLYPGQPPAEPLSERAAAVLRLVAAHPGITIRRLRQELGSTPYGLLHRLVRAGLLRLEEALEAPRVQIKKERHVRFAPAYRTPAAQEQLLHRLRGARQRALVAALQALQLEGVTEPPRATLLARAGAPPATLRRLVEQGILELVDKEVIRSPLEAEPPPAPSPITFHPEQQAALDRIAEAIDARRFETFLLHGVTGSGKTEVYIAALKRVRRQGRTGIILVPEIALTPQTVQRFRAHFGDEVAVLHSRMSEGERYDTWRQLRTGRYPIVIGPRSAVLAPLENLGLIVVDEEHERSYKQFDPAPRYHARDVAVYRAYLNNAVCVLGSATPSLESYLNARRGKYTLLEMQRRAPTVGRTPARLPQVRLIDLRHTRLANGNPLAPPLVRAIAHRLERGEQVILLQNRRGFAPVLECTACGWSPHCPHCSVTLTYHKVPHQLRCHYCGYATRHPNTCPQCSAATLEPLGTGTQRVEEALQTLFPEARVLRMDLDTTRGRRAHHHLLSRFARGEADILLGTQMVAKGLDFPRVTLVGVVNADTGLLLPDFRADEHTFQLLMQVAGRAGRADRPGEVLLQTRNPDHRVFRYLLRHDYVALALELLAERQQLGYPPYTRLAVVECSGPEETRVQELARSWAERFHHLQQQTPGGHLIEVLGPTPALHERLKGRYRYHVLLKAPRRSDAPALQPLLRRTLESFPSLPRSYRLTLDIDPAGLS